MAKSFNLQRHYAPLIGLLFAGLLAFPASVPAIEDPPGCSVIHGGLGAAFQSSINFFQAQAHVGDSAPGLASFGMVVNACKATNVTATVYVATGPLTNCLVDGTLIPGVTVFCPFNVLITPALVGASVNTPMGSVPGAPNAVRAVLVVDGIALAGDANESLASLTSTTIQIVTACIQVSKTCAPPPGQNCFSAGAPIQFTGSVANCGGIMLTNVTVVDSRAAQLFTTGVPPLPLLLPLTLSPGQAVGFQGSFTPTAAEICAGSAASSITVRGTDITFIGGPNASATNQTTVSCAICSGSLCLAAPTYSANGQFQFAVTGLVGSNYVVQVSTNLSASDWLSLRTNTAPFTFVESNAVLLPARFYRAMSLP